MTSTVRIKTRQKARLFPGLACALGGHTLRAVLNGRVPTGLECAYCDKTWTATPDGHTVKALCPDCDEHPRPPTDKLSDPRTEETR